MAQFEQHCKDCQIILGKKFEDVNRWLDSMFWKRGAGHRRYYHHLTGVRKAQELFGPGGAKAAVVHIVRDCGRVPRDREYDESYSLCVETEAEAFISPPLGFEQHFDLFKEAVEKELKVIFGE